MTAPRMPVTVSAHVDESTIVQAKAHSAVEAFALIALSDRHVCSVNLFFPTVADMDRLIEAMVQVRHELAALTGQEPEGDTANTTMTTHADTGVS